MRAANAGALLVCDPVFGDGPGGLYIDAAAAAAIAEHLLPACDLATPNAFELAWLSGAPVETLEAGGRRRASLGVPAVLATSIPAGDDRLATLARRRKRQRKPALCLDDRRLPMAQETCWRRSTWGIPSTASRRARVLARAAAAVEASIALSTGRDELSLASGSAIWTETAGLPTVTL